MTAVALVPLRGGSKSIPRKNIRPLGGKPLFWWATQACRESGIFERIVVSTDSDEIAGSVRAHFPDVEILQRPPSLAADDASTEAVMLHFAEHYAFDVVCLVQATSPLLTATDLRAGWERFVRDGLDSLVSCVRSKRFFWSDDGRPINYDPGRRPRRQDHRGTLMENGAFYLTRRETLLTARSRLGGRIGVSEMPDETAIEVDDPADWLVIEQLIRARLQAENRRRAHGVRLLVLDCDGTLTDAGMYYSAEGELLKKFNTRDGKGLELVRAAGVQVALITGEQSAAVAARARKLKIDDCFLNVQDKLSALTELARKHGLRLDEVAYMGDDVNDLPCLGAVGFSCCPQDAIDSVKAVAGFVSNRRGGDGAVREVADFIVAAKAAMNG